MNLFKKMSCMIIIMVFTCKYCPKTYTQQSNLCRHQKTCQMQCKECENCKILQQEIAELRRIQNISTSITINNICDFTNPRLDHISDEILLSCVNDVDNGLFELIKAVHFNPNVKDNHNIRLKSSKKETVDIYVNGVWILEDDTKACLDIIRARSRQLLHKLLKDDVMVLYDNYQLEKFAKMNLYLNSVCCMGSMQFYAMRKKIRVLLAGIRR